MGDAAVSALVSEVVGRLTSVVINELALLWGFKDDILTLKEDFKNLQAVLEDAEDKQIKEKTVELWLQSLRSASLEIENVLDDILAEALLQRLHKERGIKYRVRAFFSSDHNPIRNRIRIAHKVKAIRRKLDAIASKKSELSLTHSVIGHVDVACDMPDRETSSFIHDSSLIFGRNEETEMVAQNICNKDIGKFDNGEIRVYGIWGMGGVGKTTLAQLVYNHDMVNKYFNLKCWVYVSENFQVKEILKNIIESIDNCGCTLTVLDKLQEYLQSKLRGKKFVIVLDDVWIEEGERIKWNNLRETLSCGAEESVILMTTRYQTTSQMMAKVPELQHELGCLSEKDSWLLFKKHAFVDGRVGGDISELEPIGRKIVEKCKGLPLAVKTLGSLMWSKSSISDWQHVKDNNIWELKENKILPALKLSYDYLLPHVKRCFAYCCLFPKGYNMEKDVLIPLWVSNGFIPRKGETDLYALGEEIFNCLVWRSFFQAVKADSKWDRAIRYKMHDLMHDMARYVSGHDYWIIESGKDLIFHDEVLHFSSQCPDIQFSPGFLGNLTSLRSIFMYGKLNEGAISQLFNHGYLRVIYLADMFSRLPESLSKLKHLKYLSLSNSSIHLFPRSLMYLQNLQVLVLISCYNLIELPDSICKLKHLKYLNLSHSSIEVLPESIMYLQNLQVLLLFSCKQLRWLPRGLRYMVNLQRLDISYCSSLTFLPFGFKELTSLRILPWFFVWRGEKIGELGDLNLLEGELEISGLENVRGLSEAKSANIKCKRNLLVLILAWSYNHGNETAKETIANAEEVLEGLEPNPCLIELRISTYIGKIISSSWMANLRNLVKISFYKFLNCTCLPPLGRLPNLRVIHLMEMNSLKCFHDDDKIMLGDTNMFPRLQELDIGMCSDLVSLPNNLPNLKVLKLEECDKLVFLPDNLPSIRKLYLMRCDGLLSLPDDIQSFKDLNELLINKCRHLSERCKTYIGVDWPKISHIPNVHIDPPSDRRWTG